MDMNWNEEAAVTGESTVRGSVKINLEEQDHSFALDKSSAVRGILNIRQEHDHARINIRVRNLQADKGTYKIFFLGRKDGISVYKMMGEIIPDKDGTAEFYASVKSENIDGEGTALSYFYIFLIAAAGEPLRPVLKGDIVRHQADPVQKEKRRDRRKNPAVYNSYYNEYIKHKTGELLRDSADFTHISPFDDVWLADSWKRVTDITKLPVASAGAERQICRYGHFIFASSEDRFYLAVPGRHTDEEWPDRGRSGFVMWQSIRNSKEYGYWCMVIERKSGIITEIS